MFTSLYKGCTEVHITNVRVLCLFSGIILVGCAGTGTKDFSLLVPVVQDPSAEAVVVIRQTDSRGSVGLIDVVVDGITVATLGNGEMLAHPVTVGRHTINVAYTGISSIGTNAVSKNFEVEEGEKTYYTIRQETGFFSATLSLIETTRDSFLGL